MDSLFLIAIVLAAAVFMVILPQRRRQRRHDELLASMGPGARVMLTSGIHGTVVSTDGDLMRLEIAPGVEIEVDRRAVAEVVRGSESDGDAPADTDETSGSTAVPADEAPRGADDPAPHKPDSV